MTDSFDYRNTTEYQAISDFYGDRKDEHSQVPLINHIDQGVAIIAALNQRLPCGRKFRFYGAALGFCLHPLFQSDAALHGLGIEYASHPEHDSYPVVLAMEYRARANDWLSDKVMTVIGKSLRDARPIALGLPSLGVIPEVHAMLIAEKVQTYKDFLDYYKGTHPRSDELELYFKTWLAVLEITDQFTYLQEVARKAERRIINS